MNLLDQLGMDCIYLRTSINQHISARASDGAGHGDQHVGIGVLAGLICALLAAMRYVCEGHTRGGS